MKPISERKRVDILALVNQSLSSREISRRVGVSHSTVCKIRKANNPEAAVSRGGRPRIVTPQLQRLVIREITSGQSSTAENVRKKLRENHKVDLSAETVRNVLRDAGMKGMPKQKKPKLSARHIKARLDFAQKHSSWTIDDWKRVIWSDETRVNRLGSDGRLWCWKKPGERLKRQHVKETLKFGGGCLMVWGCMLHRGVGWMCRIDGGMDAQLYTEILDSYVKQSAEYYDLNPDHMIFQQDNDPKHTSRLARQWLQDHNVELLDWPAQSPDLNPIEHLWDHLKRQLNGYEYQPKGMHELWERVETEWNNIPQDVCKILVESMPQRIEEVLKAKGGYTRY